MNELACLLKLTQEELKLMLYDYLLEKKMKPVFEDGFLYAEGDIPILVVAHMDTVFKEPPINIFYSKKEDKFFNPYGGLGGDDRCGVYAIMQLLKKYRPHVLFTEDEEIGCIGARKTLKKLAKPNVKYIIEFDRRGSDDCVFYDCGNEEFMDYVESFGFKTNYGSYSDISILGSKWDIASVNLSSGYYNEHTEKEYIIFHELNNNIARAEKMLSEYEKAKYFDYQEVIRKSTSHTGRFILLDYMTDDEWLACLQQFYKRYQEPVKNGAQEKKLILRNEEKSKGNKGNTNRSE